MCRIVVHGGKAHSDDFLSCCFLIHMNQGAKIYRRSPTQEEMKDDQVFVVDQGMDFNPDLKNFDHHHLDQQICSFTQILDDYFGKEYRAYVPSTQLVEAWDSRGFKGVHDILGLPRNKIPLIENIIGGAMINMFSNVTELNRDHDLYGIMERIGDFIHRTIVETPYYVDMIHNKSSVCIYKNLTILDCSRFSTPEVEFNNYFEIYKRVYQANFDVVLVQDVRTGGFRLKSDDINKLRFQPNQFCHFVHINGFLACFKEHSDFMKVLDAAWIST